MPKRIQRQRAKGWTMPANTIYVGRPTVWGNPFWSVALEHGVDLSLKLYRELVQGTWDPSLLQSFEDWYVTIVSQSHQRWLQRLNRHPREAMRELRGKDLACWCALDKPCHADILLELANG